MAFGTGTHPTTQLCLAALEDYLQPGQTVADLGCGSGILSIAAARLGARRVLAVDIDAQAVESARQNVERNASGRPHPGRAGLAATRARRVEPAGLALTWSGQHPGAGAPGDAPSGLAPAVAPGGMLVLSGILDHQAASRDRGLRGSTAWIGRDAVEQADWRALVLERTTPPG